MARQSAPIQEVSRLLDLVPFLSTHSHISLKELAREFGVDEKSMANELTALSMCGLPGYTPYELIEIYFDSGFVTINNHEALDIPRALTSLEVASLLIGLEILRESAVLENQAILPKIDQLITEMRGLIGSAIDVKEDAQTSHRAAIDAAIASRKSLNLQYFSPVRDEITTRHVDPLSIEVERGFTYLVAFCHTHNSVRNFRLDRITSLSRSEEGITEVSPDMKSESEKTSLSLTVSGSRRSIAELLTTGPIPRSGEVKVEVYSPEWAVKAVIAHSPDVRLNEPQELREKTLQDLTKILALYAP